MIANAERKTWAGHGKPQDFLFLGTGKSPQAESTLAMVTKEGDGALAVTSCASGHILEKITGNTKFWAILPGSTVEVDSLGAVVARAKALEAELAEARDLARGMEQTIATMQAERDETVGRLEEKLAEAKAAYVPVATLDALMEEMDTSRKAANGKAAAIRKNAKASYQDRLHRSFLEGTAKTAAYFLGRLSAIVDPVPADASDSGDGTPL